MRGEGGEAGPEALLSLRDLAIEFPSVGSPAVGVVRGVSFDLQAGDFVGLVGESGSGKSLTALAIIGLVPQPGRITAGRILLDGRDLVPLPDSDMRRIRGRRIGLVFQEPTTALNPVLTIGFQIAEAVRAHEAISRKAALVEAQRLLELVAIGDARRRLGDYPHQLSGGQRQRVLIAMALAGRPDVLLADEPTTALDVTVQAQILELLQRLRRDLDLTIVLITHDLAVVAETCDRVLVMYAGQLVEDAPVQEFFANPAHPYSRGLIDAQPRMGREIPRGELPVIPGQVPDPAALPRGCAFTPRCARAMPQCSEHTPDLCPLGEPASRAGTGARRVRCFLHSTVDEGTEASR